MYKERSDTGHGSQDFHFHGLHILLGCQTFVHINVNESAFMGADDPVGLALQKLLDGQIAHFGSGNTVTGIGRTASLDMAQDSDTGIQIGTLLDDPGNLGSTGEAFRHDDHVVGEAVETSPADLLDQFFLSGLMFGDQNSGGAGGQTNIHSQITGVTAHDFNHRAALVGLHGVSQLVDALDGGVCGAVEADAVVGAADIVIDGSGNTDDVNAELAQRLCTPEGAVAADGNDAVQTQEFAGGCSLALTFLSHKFLAAGSVEDSAALVDDAGNTLFIQPLNVTADQAVPATADAVNFHTVIPCGTDNTADTGIHAGGIAAAGKYADSLYAHDRFLQCEYGITSSL